MPKFQIGKLLMGLNGDNSLGTIVSIEHWSDGDPRYVICWHDRADPYMAGYREHIIEEFVDKLKGFMDEGN